MQRLKIVQNREPLIQFNTSIIDVDTNESLLMMTEFNLISNGESPYFKIKYKTMIPKEEGSLSCKMNNGKAIIEEREAILVGFEKL